MALTKCTECGREVSDKAAACPQCGAPVIAQAAAPATPPTILAAAASPAVKPKPRVRVATLVLLVVLAGVAYVVLQMRSGSSLRSAVAGPETVVSEMVSLDEGRAMGYSFVLPTPRRVEVAVTASPKAVNVYLMTDQDWDAFNKSRQKLLGGKFTYRRALSSESVLNMKQSDIIPAGSWRIVVERPSEALFGGKSTAASVKITAL